MWSALVLGLVSACRHDAIPPSRWTATLQPAEVVIRSKHGGTAARSTWVIAGDDDWRRLWDTIRRNEPTRPPTPPPVDFATHRLFAAAAGAGDSMGPDVAIDGVSVRGDTVAVLTCFQLPSRSGAHPADVVEQVVVVRIPRTPGPVLSLTRIARSCGRG